MRCMLKKVVPSVAFGLAAACALAVPQALADASDVVLTVQAGSARSTGTFQVTSGDGTWIGDTFTWSASERIEISDGTTVLGSLLPGTTITLSPDPQVSLSFAVQSGNANTDFTISSSLLSVPPISNAAGRASAAFSATDLFGDGAALTGNGPTGGSYLTQYNGYVPSGSTFAEAIPEILVTENSTVAVDANVPPVGYAPIPDVVTDMSAQIVFTLSPNDIASGTTNYRIVPEPSAMLLLAAGAFWLSKRR